MKKSSLFIIAVFIVSVINAAGFKPLINKNGTYVPFDEKYTIAKADFTLPYSAAINKDNFYATQFHPEKSGSVGAKILKNFLEL